MNETRLPVWEQMMRDLIGASSYGPQPEWQVLALEKTGSTMDAARGILAQVAPAGPGLVIAREQLHGRGRRGNRWRESAGNLYATFIFADPRRCAQGAFALVTALAAAQVLSDLGCEAVLKWPNDLLSARRKKLGGILIECCAAQEQSFLMIGIGINLETVPYGMPSATSVRQEGGELVSPPCFAGRLAPTLYSFWQEFQEKGFREFRDRWLLHAAYLGEELEIEGEHARIRGRFTGVDELGRMQLMDHQGKTHAIVSGHVIVES